MLESQFIKAAEPNSKRLMIVLHGLTVLKAELPLEELERLLAGWE